MENADKARRQRTIRAVLKEESVANQKDLSRLLARKGMPVAQGTLSRDLREMRILRVPAADGYRYTEAAEAAVAEPRRREVDKLQSVAALEVMGIESNETAVVVRTLPGRAQGVAVWLDAQGLDDLLATVAGDDTILVLPRSVKRTARLKTRLASALGW